MARQVEVPSLGSGGQAWGGTVDRVSSLASMVQDSAACRSTDMVLASLLASAISEHRAAFAENSASRDMGVLRRV